MLVSKDTQILIVDDSQVCSLFAAQAVHTIGQTKCVTNAHDAMKALNESHWDIVLLDIHIGAENGFKIYEEMQKSPNLRTIPVIFVSGDNDISQKTMAFQLGADDYIVKPYNFLELQMRVIRTLKRHNFHQDFIEFGPFKLSTHQMLLVLDDGTKKSNIDLSPKEYQLMKFLMENPHQIFSRQQLLDKVWGQDMYITDRTVDTHIYSLRKKLGSLGKSLISVRSWGYQLVNPVSQQNNNLLKQIA